MHSEFRRTRSPYGFPFLDTAITENLYKKTEKIKELLTSENYKGVIPATLDFPETFQEYETSSAFQARDSLGEDLYLRSDATAQVIKGFTNLLEHADVSAKEYRFFYMLPVFRDARKNYPELREIFQVGVENIGMDSLTAIPDLIRLADHIMRQIMQVKVKLILGDIRVFHYINDSINNPDMKDMMLSRDVPSLNSLFAENGWNSNDCGELMKLLLFAPEYTEWKNRWSKLKHGLNNNVQLAFMDDIERLVQPARNMCESLFKEKIEISWEPVLVRKVDYYTGLIFEGYVEGLSLSPLRGGVYDNLIGKYSSKDMSACGFAVDMTGILLL
jgi:ATP phosphoribosyltransferase regulatory subunit